MLSRKFLGGFAALASALLLFSPLTALAEEPERDTLGAYKLLGPTGQNGYEMFANAPGNKAFAVSEDGAWGVAFGLDDIDAAQAEAKTQCETVSDDEECTVFAVNGYVLLPDGEGGKHLVEDKLWRYKNSLDEPAPEVRYPVPYVGMMGREAFETYLAADEPKAFAVARDGSWAWRAGMQSSDQALNEALDACQKPGVSCTIYAVNGRITADLSTSGSGGEDPKSGVARYRGIKVEPQKLIFSRSGTPDLPELPE